jgi:hypothetical protein
MEKFIITPPPYKHKEAFALMYYENKETKTGFMVWNSRDGVTPFIVFEGSKEYQHTHWGMDKIPNQAYVESHLIKDGQRIFRDTTEAEAVDRAARRVRSFNGTEFEVEVGSDRYNDLITSLTQDFLQDPHMEIIRAGSILTPDPNGNDKS